MANLAQAVSGGTPSKENPDYWNGTIPWVSPKDMKVRVIHDAADHITEDAVEKTRLSLIAPPSVLIVVRGMILAHTFPVGITTVPVTINQDMKALRIANDADPEYFAYAIDGISKYLLALVEEAGHGTKVMRTDLWRAVKISLPPLDEQRTIAAFLDRETAKIDALVAKKRRLIELLQEKRTALITRAVTKGLDPSAPMKASGVEWLGEIPAHWNAMRLKFLLEEPLKYGANEAAELADRELPRYVRITDIDDAGCLRDETFRSLPEEVAAPYLLRDGDLLFARSGATAGKTFLYRTSWGTCAYAGYLIRARIDGQALLPRFARYFTAASNYWQWISSTLIQATIQNVSAERYANLWLALPSLAEQHAIGDSLDRETNRVTALINQVEAAIESIEEFRTALISAAVTGKIDVREEVA